MNTDKYGQDMPNTAFAMSNTKCPKCGSIEFELKNYDMAFHDGDIHCANCGQYIRRFDAG